MVTKNHVIATIVQSGHLCTDAHKQILMAPYIAEGVKTDLFSIHGDKVLGPNGFGGNFFRDAWDVIGMDVVDAVLDVLIEIKGNFSRN